MFEVSYEYGGSAFAITIWASTEAHALECFAALWVGEPVPNHWIDAAF